MFEQFSLNRLALSSLDYEKNRLLSSVVKGEEKHARRNGQGTHLPIKRTSPLYTAV